MRKLCLALCIVSLFSATPSTAQVSVGFNAPGFSIGVDIGSFPRLVQIPGYPVYYAPNLDANYFFYDGMFWLYDGYDWYTSAWYDGPWGLVSPFAVPVYLLRVPVRYYRRPPPYFRSWVVSAPPHWGEHWGQRWEEQRRGWDRWDRRAVPAPAPLPTYQRQYAGSRYPRVQEQQTLQMQHYNYRPREATAQQFYERIQSSGATSRGQVAATPQEMQQRQAGRQGQGDEMQRPNEPPQRAERSAPQRQARDAQRMQQQQVEQQRARQQAPQQQAEQMQRAQQQSQQRQAEQAQRNQQQAQQRQAEQAQRAQRQGERAQHEHPGQAKGQEQQQGG